MGTSHHEWMNPPVDHGVMLEIALDDALGGGAHQNHVITGATHVSILPCIRTQTGVKNDQRTVWPADHITCNCLASSQVTPSRMCDWGPALIPPWRRFSLICFCFCLNSLGVVPIGTNWCAISSLTGVLLCVGEPSGTHCTNQKTTFTTPELSNACQSIRVKCQSTRAAITAVVVSWLKTIPLVFCVLLGGFWTESSRLKSACISPCDWMMGSWFLKKEKGLQVGEKKRMKSRLQLWKKTPIRAAIIIINHEIDRLSADKPLFGLTIPK